MECKHFIEKVRRFVQLIYEASNGLDYFCSNSSAFFIINYAMTTQILIMPQYEMRFSSSSTSTYYIYYVKYLAWTQKQVFTVLLCTHA